MDKEQADKALSYILDKQGSRPILIATQEVIPIKDSKKIEIQQTNKRMDNITDENKRV